MPSKNLGSKMAISRYASSRGSFLLLVEINRNTLRCFERHPEPKAKNLLLNCEEILRLRLRMTNGHPRMTTARFH